MSDFKNDLRRFIDGLEKPVSVQETMSRRRKRRFRAPAAVLAGAAIVMIPALVLIGIRFLPGENDQTAQTTAPAISETSTTVTDSTMTTTTTTAAPVSLVTVPDIVGLSVEQAEDVLAALGLELEVIEMRPSSDFTGISAQEPVGSTSVTVGSTVIVDVYVPPTCLGDELSIPAGSMGVTILLQCGTSNYPDISYPITRAVTEDPSTMAATLRALLAGPTEGELSNGYSSFFSSESAGALNVLALDEGRLRVDFNDAILVNNASTSTGSMFFMAELQANLFQFSEVDLIEFQLNGSCDAFFGWLQGECQILTRDGWEDAVDSWRSQNEAETLPGRDIDPAQLLGLTFTATLVEGSTGIDQLVDGDRFDSGFDEVGGWLLGDDTSDEFENWAIHVAGHGVEMVWLVESQGHTEEGRMIYVVRGTAELPWDEFDLKGDPTLMTGQDFCTRGIVSVPNLVVMNELSDPDTGEMNELRAWLIDISGARFVEIPTDDIACQMEVA